MPRGGYRQGAGRKQKVDTFPEQKLNVVQALEVKPVDDKTLSASEQFLQGVMLNDEADLRMRLEAAKALLPYQAKKPAEGGVKKQREDAAKEKAKKFQAITPPRLVNG